MDGALSKSPESYKINLKKCMNIIDEAERNNGILTLLWHQRVFNENEFPGWSRIYEEIIKECKRREAFFARCIDIYKRKPI